MGFLSLVTDKRIGNSRARLFVRGPWMVVAQLGVDIVLYWHSGVPVKADLHSSVFVKPLRCVCLWAQASGTERDKFQAQTVSIMLVTVHNEVTGALSGPDKDL